MTGNPESAGINWLVVGDERADIKNLKKTANFGPNSVIRHGHHSPGLVLFKALFP
jgi:hypothetical protein